MSKIFPRLFLCACLLLATCGIARAQQPAPAQASVKDATWENGRIVVVRVNGEAYVFKTGETLRFALRNGSLVTPGQMISTGPKASVMLAFSNGATVTIGEKSLISVDEFTQKPFGEMFKMSEASKEPSASTTRMNMVRGEVISNVKKLNKDEGSTFEIKTPVGIAGIRGTTFRIAFEPDQGTDDLNPKPGAALAAFSLVMLEGSIEMRLPGKSKPILIPQGKQFVLTDIASDAEGNIIVAEAEHEAAESPASAQAALLQHAQAMLSAVSALAIPASGSDAEITLPATRDGAGKQDSEKGGQNIENVSRSPRPQNPAPRLSPTDGAGVD